MFNANYAAMSFAAIKQYISTSVKLLSMLTKQKLLKTIHNTNIKIAIKDIKLKL